MQDNWRSIKGIGGTFGRSVVLAHVVDLGIGNIKRKVRWNNSRTGENMKILLVGTLTIILMGIPRTAADRFGEWATCYRVRIETTNTGCMAKDIYYPCFVGKGY